MVINDDTISDSLCTCPRGQAICHNIAALCIFIHNNFSSTDLPCTWNTRKANNDNDVQSINDIYPSKPYVATNSIPDDNIDRFKQALGCIGIPVGMTWLLKSEPPVPPPELCSLISVEQVLFSEEYITSKNKQHFLTEKLLVSNDIILKIAQETVGQTKNDQWLIYKTNKLTASNFGAILAAMMKKNIPKSLLKSLNNEYGSIRAIEWGLINESTAVNVLQQTEKITVQPTGLWLHPCGFIGASPDGLIGEDDTVEV